MSEQADVVVLGSGVMGASIAFQLVKRGAGRVIAVDPGGPAAGMSGRSFRQVRRHYSNEVLILLANRGYEIFHAWAQEVGVADAGYVRLGYLLLIGEEAVDACLRNVALGKKLGVDSRFVSAEEIHEIEPLLQLDGVAGGAYEPSGGVVDPVRMCLAWHAAGTALGLEAISARATGVDVSGGRVRGVTIGRGRIQAPVVVNAAGPWGRDLAATAGVELPIRFVPLDMASLRQAPAAPRLSVEVTDATANLVIRPDLGPMALAVVYPDGLPTVESPDRAGPAPDFEAMVRTALRRRVPDYADAVWEGAVSGVYDSTPDWHPIVGWAPGVEGLYLALGWSGHGLKLSPAVGEVVADEILGRTPAVDIGQLRPTRFAEDRLMPLAYGPGARA